MKSRSHVFPFSQVRTNYFNGNWSLERLVHTGIHCTHAPASNAPFQPVAFREDARHVHTNESRSILSAHVLSCIETPSAFCAFLKAVPVCIRGSGTCCQQCEIRCDCRKQLFVLAAIWFLRTFRPKDEKGFRAL